MSKQIIPIDASKLPDLLRIAEEVNTTKTPRLISNYSGTLFEPPAAAGEARKRGHPAPRQGHTVPQTATASPCTPC
jgi:hypothetical protein